MRKQLFYLSVVLVFLFAAGYGFPAYSGLSDIGKVIVKKNDVFLERNGRDIRISSFGAWLRQGDVVKTGSTGKAAISLKNGDSIFLAPNASLTINARKKRSGLTNFIMRIFGKIRAKIRKTKTRNYRFTTPSAVIGVKGTDFVLEYKDKKTTVATVKGLVNLKSKKTADTIDIPPGKMSSISPAGEVLPLSEFSGEIMKGVEFAGEQMDAVDFSGKKLEM